MVRIRKLNEEDIDEKAIVRMQAILDSMTKREREFPQLIDGKRKKRIAKGSGTTVQEINRLLKQYLMMRKMMRSFSKGFGAWNTAAMIRPGSRPWSTAASNAGAPRASSSTSPNVSTASRYRG